MTNVAIDRTPDTRVGQAPSWDEILAAPAELEKCARAEPISADWDSILDASLRYTETACRDFDRALDDRIAGRPDFVGEPGRPTLDLMSLFLRESNCPHPVAGTLLSEPIDGNHLKRNVIQIPCGTWDCDTCGPAKAKRFEQGVKRSVLEHKLTRFGTLTLDPRRNEVARMTPRESIVYIRHAWAELRKKFHRLWHGRRMLFVAIVEMQKNGRAHIHFLANRFIPKDWLQKAWREVGGGWVKMKYVDNPGRAAGYMAKYLRKSVYALPHGVRRFSASKGVRVYEPKKPSASRWFWNARHLPDWKRALEDADQTWLIALTLMPDGIYGDPVVRPPPRPAELERPEPVRAPILSTQWRLFDVV